MSITALAIALYIGALSWIVWRGRSQAASDDMYNIFGRRANVLRATAGYLSLIGAGELVTIAQLGYQNGLSLLWFPLGVGTGFILISFFGGRVRERALELGTNTIVGLVEKEYGKATAIGVMFTYMIALGALLTIQFIVGGQLLAEVAGINSNIMAIGLGVIIVCYLLIGGYVAVLSTDILRLVFLAVALIVLIASVYFSRSEMVANTKMFEPLSFFDGFTLYLLGVFGAVCAGDVWQTVLASASTKVVRRSMLLAAFCFVAFGLLIGLLGMEARLVENATTGLELPALVLAYKYVIPDVVAPLLALVIVGSIMATADTEIWVLSSSIVALSRSPKVHAASGSEQRQIRKATTYVIPIVGLCGLGLALTTKDSQSVYEVLLILLASIAPAMIAALLGVTNRLAVVVSLYVSLISFFATLAFYKMAIPPYANFLPATMGVVAFVVMTIVTPLKLRPPARDEAK